MKKIILFIVTVLLAWRSGAVIYEVQDVKGGVLYTDQYQSGAKTIELFEPLYSSFNFPSLEPDRIGSSPIVPQSESYKKSIQLKIISPKANTVWGARNYPYAVIVTIEPVQNQAYHLTLFDNNKILKEMDKILKDKTIQFDLDHVEAGEHRFYLSLHSLTDPSKHVAQSDTVIVYKRSIKNRHSS